MNPTPKPIHVVEVHTFAELKAKPLVGGNIIAEVAELAALLRSDKSRKDNRDRLRDHLDYQPFIIDHPLKEGNFGAVFIIREISTTKGKVIAFLISFHNHPYGASSKQKYFESNKFPFTHCQRFITHDLAYLRDLNVLGTFAYCYQVGVHPENRGLRFIHMLLDKFERYYCEGFRIVEADANRTNYSLTKEVYTPTLLLAASIHEEQRSMIEVLKKRNDQPFRHKDLFEKLDFKVLFLDHEVEKGEEEKYWFRTVQIPDYNLFQREVNYNKIIQVAETIIPIQLNKAVEKMNRVLIPMKANILWSSFFYDHERPEERRTLPRGSHGFFQSLLMVNEKKYYEMRPRIKQVMEYLQKKSSNKSKVISLTRSFRKNPRKIFFFAKEPHELESFSASLALSLSEKQETVRNLAVYLLTQEVYSHGLSTTDRFNWQKSFRNVITYGLSFERERQRWITRLGISDEDVNILEEGIKFSMPGYVREEGAELDRDEEFKAIVRRIDNGSVIKEAALKQLEDFVDLHQKLYEVDAEAFDLGKDYWWCHAVLPISNSFRQEVAGIMFTFRCEKTSDDPNRMDTVAQAIASSLPHSLLNNIIKLQDNDSAELSARYSISAVTTRNMAHHLGSHILDNLDSEVAIRRLYDDGPFSFHLDMATFLGFVRTKTHLLADLTSTNPVSSVNWQLNGEVLHGFRKQEIMCSYVSGTHIKEIDILYKDVDDNEDKDITVQIPNGDLGGHAFYMLLTNIIRNVAKYEDTSDLDVLTITVRVVPKDGRSKLSARGYEILIYDNVPRDKGDLGDLVDDLNHRMEEQRSRLGNDIRSAGWGLQEMMAAAIYLRKKGAEHSLSGGTEESEIKFLVAEIREEWNEQKECFECFLAYRIYLKKPRLALVIDYRPEPVRQEKKWHKKSGVRRISEQDLSEEPNRNFSHVFAVSTYKKCRENVGTTKRLPLRWINLYIRAKRETLNENLYEQPLPEFTNYLWKEWTDQYILSKEMDVNSAEVIILDKNNPKLPSQYADGSDHVFIYDHHGSYFPKGLPTSEVGYYQAFRSVCPTGRMIASRRRGDENTLIELKYQLLEAALTRVVILDERIQRQASEITQEKKTDHFKVLEQMGIYVPILNRESDKGSLQLDKGNQSERAALWLAGQLTNQSVDFVVLHLGLLESWLKPAMPGIEKWIKKYVSNVNASAEIVLISGRGRPVGFPKDMCYLPASTVAEYTVSGPPSKFHLTQMLFSSRTRLNL